jgi:outer membrane protein TolC
MDILKTACVAGALSVLGSGCALMHPTAPYAGMTSRPNPVVGGQSTSARQPARGLLTLDEAIRLALANNPEVAASEHDTTAAGARRDMASAQRLPNVHVVGGYTRYGDGQRLMPASENGEEGVFSQNIFASDLVVSLPLFTGGRISSELRAADLLRAAADHRLVRTREELVFNVSSVFHGVLAQRRVIESLKFSKTALLEHLKRVADLIAAQKAARVDQLRTEVRVADLDQRLSRERNVLAIQLRVLANLLGAEGGQDLDPAGELTLTNPALGNADSVITQALAKRPDYLAARAVLEAQAKSVDAARAGHWPTVSLQGAYGGRWAADPTDAPSGTAQADDVGRIGLVVDIPLFEGGRIEATVREQRAKLVAAQERLRKLELQIRLEVESAILNITSASERVAATEKAVEQARESLRIEREKYDLGKGSVTDVLDAQAALLESQMTYYRALADHETALAQLKLSTGENN